MTVLFLKPYFQEKIWGGNKLKTEFNYDIPSNHTGECWAISAHPNGESIVLNGKYQGMKLSEVWKKYPELFGNSSQEQFPLLTKILDANDDLSVQVHPDDEYGLEHEGELGKTECWYVIDSNPDSTIIFGHHAQTKEEFLQLVQDGKWKELLREVPVKKGDFFYVPSGTIHAIGKGITILETQQSSDTTYRVYDFDRVDDQGQKRELHIEDSVNVATIPAEYPQLEITKQDINNSQIVKYLESPYFDIYKWLINDQVTLKATSTYILVSIISGSGSINVGKDCYQLSKGDNFIIPNDVCEWTVDGQFEAIVSTPGFKNK